MSKSVTFAALVLLTSACGGSAPPAEPPSAAEPPPSAENPGTIAPATDEKTTPTEPGPWPVPTSSAAPPEKVP